MASNNSSKTAHVMNLLSKNRGSAPEPPAEPKAEPAAPQAEPAPQAALYFLVIIYISPIWV